VIALATCADMPTSWQEEELLAKLAPDARFAVWDDPEEDWAAYELVVLRATWDYSQRRDAFLDWVASVPRLANAPLVVAWNTDKRYLADVAAAGIPVVPTSFAALGEEPDLPREGELVVKPSVSAGSRDTGRFSATDPAQRAAALELVAAIQRSHRTAMVQPYLEAIDAHGETALLYAGGVFSHAIRKAPILQPGQVAALDHHEDPPIELREPTAAERLLADRTMAWLAERFGDDALTYARIDLIPDAAGDPVVLELELTEPSLFLPYAPGAAARFAAAIRAAAARAA
jgi:glutathione synthase/RimK-type ligase-like ATP-grasp enzyme